MAKGTPLSAIKEVLKLQRAQLQGIVELRGVRKMAPIYEKARAGIEQRLAELRRRGQGKSFTAHHLRQVLTQVNVGVQEFEKALGTHLKSTGALASTVSQRHLINSVKRFEGVFTGHTPVLQIEQAAVFRKVYTKVQPSLLNRYKKSVRLYTKPVVTKVRESLALSLLNGDSVDAAIDRVAASGGIIDSERWRAERITRTELSYTYGVVKQKTMDTLAGSLPQLQKKLVATFDSRTGDDSKELHGQTVPYDKPFIWEKKTKSGVERIEYMQPPNRPNDREIVIPWLPIWTDPAMLEEGHSGPGPVTPELPST